MRNSLRKIVKVAIRILHVLENDPRFMTSPSLEFHESNEFQVDIFIHMGLISIIRSIRTHTVNFKFHLWTSMRNSRIMYKIADVPFKCFLFIYLLIRECDSFEEKK